MFYPVLAFELWCAGYSMGTTALAEGREVAVATGGGGELEAAGVIVHPEGRMSLVLLQTIPHGGLVLDQACLSLRVPAVAADAAI